MYSTNTVWYNGSYCDEKYSDIVCVLGSDADALLVGLLTFHLCPEVSVEQHAIAPRGPHH